MKNKLLVVFHMLLCFGYAGLVFGTNISHYSSCIGNRDTTIILANGLYYGFSFNQDSTYHLFWGNDRNHFDGKYVFEPGGNGILGYVNSDDSIILLAEHCGMSCMQYVVLSVSSGDEIVYPYVIANDFNKHLIAYVITYANERMLHIEVENFVTRKRQSVVEKKICSAILEAECIDSARFDKGKFVLKWYTSNDRELVTKKYKLKL